MGDPLDVNNLTTKLMIENRQSSEKFVAGLVSLSILKARGADRGARAAHADRVRQRSANFKRSTWQHKSSTIAALVASFDSDL
jgi:hypothetical protein